MNEAIKQQILEQIIANDTIMLFRHKRMDGDCVGASKGLKEIIRATWPQKRVILTDSQRSEYLEFVGPDDADVEDAVYQSALAIVVDTGDRERISNQKYLLCRQVIKIDHHIPVDQYGDINWVEEERSSACEMIADFWHTFRDQLKLTQTAATHIYMGMVTDSGRFRFEGVTGDTLRLAALMLDQGVDAQTLYAHLYLEDFDMLGFKAYVYEHMEKTENGVAYIRISPEVRRLFHLDFEAASDVVSYLENIRGCLCWLAFIDCDDPAEGIRVRLRSRFMAVSDLAARYHGGGHANAAGATVYSEEEMEALIREADWAVKIYKESHGGWM